MKTASIVSIGNEILSGLTVDTNAAYMSERLMRLGVATVSSYTVGDDISKITQAIERAGGDADIILITGGLGPTDDDITREGLAGFLGAELVFSEESFEQIKAYFARRGRVMAEKNRSQAYLPAGSEALENTVGTAPSIWAEKGDKIFVCMPGVPIEMKQVFEDYVFGRIESLLEEADERSIVVSRKLKCFGAGESDIAEMLGAIMKRGRNPLINCTVHEAVITLHIVATAPTADKAEEMIEKDMHHLRDILDDMVFGEDEQTIAEVLGQLLCERGLTLAVAESCTGGLIAKMITDIPGASQYFKIGWVTYTNEAKNSELKVDMALIDKHGAVSSQVAEAMALGARLRSRADIGIGVTGIAGPGGESAEKPVGLVYIGLSYADKDGVRIGKDVVLRNIFSHSRGHIRRCSALTALNAVRLTVKN
jgi:nicotinamide-nucleotide amidase